MTFNNNKFGILTNWRRRHGAKGCVVIARFLPPSVQVVCKVVDNLRYPSLADEARAYAALQDLQGEVIPTLYGFYEVLGFRGSLLWNLSVMPFLESTRHFA
jgi:hypothetical protein